MRIVYRASAPASSTDLLDRFGSSLSGFEERVAQALLNFERVWASRGGGKSRYSNGSFPVLYTATSEDVAFVEKGHWVVNLILAPMNMSISLPSYYLYRVRIDGNYREYGSSDDIRIVHPSDYTFCNGLGVQAVNDDLYYLLVPSARKLGGVCAPVLRKDPAQVHLVGSDEFQYSWDHSVSTLSVTWDGDTSDIVFDNVYETLGGS